MSGTTSTAGAGAATTNPDSHPAPVLRVGARGEWVKTLQEMLGITPDGVFGRATQAALMHFQHTHGLVVSGETGPRTWHLLGTDAPGHAAAADTVVTNQGVTQDAAQGMTLQKFMAGLRQVESGNDYTWKSNSVGATGAYQILASNWPSWAKAAGVDPNDTSPAAQDKVAAAKIQQYLKDFNGDWTKVAESWLQGEGATSAGQNNSDGNVNATTYAQKVLSAAGMPQAASAANATATSQTGPGTGGSLVQTVSGAGAGNAQFSQQDIAGELDNLGLPKALIQSDKGLNQVFKQIVSKQIDLSTSAGQAEAMTLFKNTKWWKARSDSQRKFDVLKADNPGEFNRQLQQKQNDLRTAAAAMGIPLNGGDLGKIANLVLRNGLDETETRRAVAQHFAYNPNGKYTGEAGLDIQGVQQLASSYYVNLGNDTINHLVDQMLANNMTPQSMTDYFKQLAESKFPHLKAQLSAGQTVADVADPYKQQMAQTLEQDPNGIKNEDPTLMKALQQPDGKGGFQLMPLWQYNTMLKQDPRWLKTNNARDALVDAGTGLLRQMGLSL